MPCLSHTITEQLPLHLRLDRYVSEYLCLLTRSQIKTRSLQAVMNSRNVKLSRSVKQGDCLELSWDDPSPADIIPQDIPLEIMYEDERCVVVNKAQGMVVHPGAGNRQGTLANAVCFRKCSRQSENAPAGIRPGIVHRLDKETSGVIIAAYDDDALTFLADQFKNRSVKKNYIAVIPGMLHEKIGRIETCIARDGGDRRRFTVSAHGKNAVTFYKVLKTWHTHSLVLLRPKTGRTHQLRVHLKYLGHPILGDSVYGCKDSAFPNASLMLHAKSLEITIPGETESKIFAAPLPDRFAEVMRTLNRRSGNGK